NRTPIRLIILASTILLSGIGFAEDTELRDLDVSRWSWLEKAAGTATKPDEQERNLMKNRNPVRVLPPEHDDDFLLRMEKLCKRRFPNAERAREGMEIVL